MILLPQAFHVRRTRNGRKIYNRGRRNLVAAVPAEKRTFLVAVSLGELSAEVPLPPLSTYRLIIARYVLDSAEEHRRIEKSVRPLGVRKRILVEQPALPHARSELELAISEVVQLCHLPLPVKGGEVDNSRPDKPIYTRLRGTEREPKVLQICELERNVMRLAAAGNP